MKPEASAQVEPNVEEEKPQKEEEQRPPQQEELLCTICGMRSCWRN
jgi:hypothetical protein